MHSLSAFVPTVLAVALFTGSVSSYSGNDTISGLSVCWQQCVDSSNDSKCDPSLHSYTVGYSYTACKPCLPSLHLV